MQITIDIATLDILSEVTGSLATDLRRSLKEKDRYATGETDRQIETRQTEDTSQLVGPSHIYDLEFGKKKGTLPSEERIKAWCQARGIDLKRVDSIRAKIYLRGYRGRQGVITNPLSDSNINNTLNDKLNRLADLVTQSVSDQIKV